MGWGIGWGQTKYSLLLGLIMHNTFFLELNLFGCRVLNQLSAAASGRVLKTCYLNTLIPIAHELLTSLLDGYEGLLCGLFHGDMAHPQLFRLSPPIRMFLHSSRVPNGDFREGLKQKHLPRGKRLGAQTWHSCSNPARYCWNSWQ